MIFNTLTFEPLINFWFILGLCIVSGALLAYGLFFKIKGLISRFFLSLIIILAIINPKILKEERKKQSDIAVVLVDKTSSQSLGNRKFQTQEALRKIRNGLKKISDLEVREYEVFDGGSSLVKERPIREGTNIMTVLKSAIAKIPEGRFAGAVLITDGQIHDINEKAEEYAFDAPIHALITGEEGEFDRRLVVDEAPTYGIVGKKVSISFRVDDLGLNSDSKGKTSRVNASLRDGNDVVDTAQIKVGQNYEFNFPLQHTGRSVFDLEVGSIKDEVSAKNNRALISVNGIRDRLRVLLVSGQPHAGERTWRNLLKSDVSVDLVHFTILRPPGKENFAPLKELSLISFPVRELFEVKLKDFDLIIFDRYLIRDILPPIYLKNVADYVLNGGAVMLTVGPEFSDTKSLYNSPLAKILPARPTGGVFELGFHPKLTEVGRRHPVTSRLKSYRGAEGDIRKKRGWGRWYRQVETRLLSGNSLMSGAMGSPLLILDRKGKGRVALLLSDHVWLWARGYDGGGPQAELLRRTAHWLMREPELEEERLSAEIRMGKLYINRSSIGDYTKEIRVTFPSGQEKKYKFSSEKYGLKRLHIPISEIGLYSITDGENKTQVASGSMNPLELTDLRATAETLEHLANETQGGIYWLADGMPNIRQIKPSWDRVGKDWVGFVKNESYTVIGTKEIAVLNSYILLILTIPLLIFIWWREGSR